MRTRVSSVEIAKHVRTELLTVITGEDELLLFARDVQIPLERIDLSGSLEVRLDQIIQYTLKAEPSLLHRFVSRVCETYERLHPLKLAVQGIVTGRGWARGGSAQDGPPTVTALEAPAPEERAIAAPAPRALVTRGGRDKQEVAIANLLSMAAGAGAQAALPEGVLRLSHEGFIKALRSSPRLIVKLETLKSNSFSPGLARFFQGEYLDGITLGCFSKRQVKYTHWYQKHFGIQLPKGRGLEAVPDAYYLFIDGHLVGWHTAIPEISAEQWQWAGGALAIALCVGLLTDAKDPVGPAMRLGQTFLKLDRGEQDLVKTFDELISAADQLPALH